MLAFDWSKTWRNYELSMVNILNGGAKDFCGKKRPHKWQKCDKNFFTENNWHFTFFSCLWVLPMSCNDKEKYKLSMISIKNSIISTDLIDRLKLIQLDTNNKWEKPDPNQQVNYTTHMSYCFKNVTKIMVTSLR